MEAIVVDALVEAVILAIRKDVINTLMDTECCRYSKRRMRKLCKKLQKRQDDKESIEEAKDYVRKSVANLSPMSSIQSESLEDLEIQPTKGDESIIFKFINRISEI